MHRPPIRGERERSRAPTSAPVSLFRPAKLAEDHGLQLDAYGYNRSTLDIDLVVEHVNQQAIVDFMEARGFETLHRSSGYSNHRHTDPVVGRVDFVYVRGDTADKIFGATRCVAGPGGQEVPVPKPEHLITMKLLALKNDPDRTFRELTFAEFLDILSRQDLSNPDSGTRVTSKDWEPFRL